MKNLLLVLSLIGLLLGSVGFAYYVLESLNAVEMSTHGYVALTLGALVSLLLGGGLMFLVFYSNRHGHDDDVR